MPSSKGKRKFLCECKKCGAQMEKFLSNLRKPERQGHVCNLLPTDLTGYTFGHLTVLGRDTSYPSGHGMKTYHICQCDCPDKTIVSITRSSLIEGRTTSCGSAYHRHQNKGERISLIGKQFLDLKVDFPTNERSSNGDIIYSCTCLNCGRSGIMVNRSSLTSLKKKNCGCNTKSAGEILIRQILIEKKYLFKEQSRILNKYYFDFQIWISDTDFVYLEYDGEQHFNKNSFFYSEEAILRDKIKNKYCLENNIPLYRIPYWDLSQINKTKDIFNEKYLINMEGI